MVSDLVILAAACDVAEHHRGYGELYVWGCVLPWNSERRISQGFVGGCDDACGPLQSLRMTVKERRKTEHL
jgi:hypothetical protein